MAEVVVPGSRGVVQVVGEVVVQQEGGAGEVVL
jgi:hypothetical protein